MRRTALLALLIVAIVATFLAGRMTRPDIQQAGGYDVRGVPVGNATLIVAEADEQMRSAAVTWRGDDVRCFFSQPAVGMDLNPFLRCGPVLRSPLDGMDPWDTFALSGDDSGGRFVLSLGPKIELQSTLDVGEVLSRPDGFIPSDEPIPIPMGMTTLSEMLRPTEYPYDSWRTATELKQCLAGSGVRTFDVSASVSGEETVERIEFLTVSFAGVERFELPLGSVPGVSMPSTDVELKRVVDRCARDAEWSYITRVRRGEEYGPTR